MFKPLPERKPDVQRPPLRIFVSSTSLDLQPERRAVEAALQRLRADTGYVGMEYFGSRDENTHRACLDEIDRSHVYVGIFAARYGSGITEDEYRRARERGIPCFIYFKAESTITLDKAEKNLEHIAKLDKLKTELRQTHTVAEFNSPDDLATKVLGDLHRWIVDQYLPQILVKEAASSTHSLKVFLCHASDDKADVRGLYQRLRADGIDPWFDEENLLPGQNWEKEIRRAVRNSDVVIVCLSPASVTKAGFIQKEIRIALDVADEQPEGVIFLIPLKLKECDVPERLHSYHWVNYYQEQGYERLKKSLNARAASLGKKSILFSGYH